ncbi:uncharacterized protein LOC114307712 isoform X2 [Camellia sinensis]|uniref:uncharacterized protein LOC114307712 isoform X2 n=1 Tax=Camellia sinensis TaxID=4442 RepID=UPI001036E133|nr:uncharacterized protein LOC114307712 isoform X2 [Camellia sinensis]
MAGRIKNWSFGSANAEKQHNGIHPFGLDGDHAQLSHRPPHEQLRQQSVRRQSIRYYSHASILINVPLKKMTLHDHHHCHSGHLTPEYVGRTVNRGSYFWSLGLRAFYFSFPLFLWIFGPIPMFISCLVLVFLLYFLDVTFDFGWVASAAEDDDHHHGEDEENNTG